MHIIVNGEHSEVGDGSSILDLLESLGLDSRAVVVELNLDIVPAENFAQVRLSPDDCLEILQFVGGG